MQPIPRGEHPRGTALASAARQGLSLTDEPTGLVVAYAGARLVVSASLGYTVYGPNSDKETVMALADKALYRIKSQ